MEIRVGQRGEIVIPKRIRERYGIVPGRTVTLQESEHIELRSKTMKEELAEWNKRVERYRTVSPEVFAEAIKGEPYEDDQP